MGFSLDRSRVFEGRTGTITSAASKIEEKSVEGTRPYTLEVLAASLPRGEHYAETVST
jgi:hypothetical protein